MNFKRGDKVRFNAAHNKYFATLADHEKWTTGEYWELFAPGYARVWTDAGIQLVDPAMLVKVATC